MSEYLRRCGPWFAILLCPVLGLVWGHGMVMPILSCLSLVAALSFVYALGALTLDVLQGDAASAGPRGIRPGVFQRLWFGQFALLALALAVSVPAYIIAWLTDRHIPFAVSLPLAASILLVRYYARRPPERRAFALPTLGAALFALAPLLAAFRAMSLHSVHAGALGHDTQQHIYWAQHVVEFGYLPLTARNLDLLEVYPRLFHLLAAAWSGIGCSVITGPFVKLMSFIQALLACGFLAEVLIVHAPDERSAGQRSLLAVLASSFITWHLTFGAGNSVYRVRDLSGTPRFAGGMVLFGLPLVVLAARAGLLRDGRAVLAVLGPVSLALAVGINPMLGPFFLAFTLPLTLVLARGLLPPAEAPRRALLRPLALGGCGALVLALSNAMLVQALARLSPVAYALRRLGVRLEAHGIDADGWARRAHETHALCARVDAQCLISEASEVVKSGAVELYDDVATGALPGLGNMEFGALYVALVLLPLVWLAVSAARGLDATVLASRARTFLVITLAMLSAMVVLTVARATLLRLANLGPEWMLLSGYFNDFDRLIGTFVSAYVVLGAWSLVSNDGVPLRSQRYALAGAVVFALVLLSVYRPRDLMRHHAAHDQYRIDWPAYRTIGKLNAFVPPGETIIVPSRAYVRHKREHLMTAEDATGSLIPYLTGNFLFGVSVGPSSDYGWPDLERSFCQSDAEQRHAFLEQTHAHWVLVRGDEAASRATLSQDLWSCGVTLASLSASYPPAFAARDIALYHIP